MTANSELEICLMKAIHAFNVREMLTKLGVPEDVKTTLELYVGENPEPLGSCEIHTTLKQDHITPGSFSLRSFKNTIANDFINPAWNTLELDKYIPDDDGKIASGENQIKVAFRSVSDDFTLNLVTIMVCCCTVMGKCCGYK